MNEDAAALGVERQTTNRAPPPTCRRCWPDRATGKERPRLPGRGWRREFSVRKFAGYGKLSGKSLDDLRAGERVEVDTAKEDPLDFVLWKHARDNEPFWASPWGNGRPGWHIECSAMSSDLLGKHFDIHGGGQDLQFPHHENEIAQSEGAHLCRFVNYWMHNGFVRVADEKMSKSLGNFFTIREILKNYDAEVVRFFILRAHYRSPLNYSDSHLDDARQALTRLYTALKSVGSRGRRCLASRLGRAARAAFQAGDGRRLQHPRSVRGALRPGGRTQPQQVAGCRRATARTGRSARPADARSADLSAGDAEQRAPRTVSRTLKRASPSALLPRRARTTRRRIASAPICWRLALSSRTAAPEPPGDARKRCLTNASRQRAALKARKP
jgi:hypothetical protein